MSRRATRVGTFEVFVPALGCRKPLPENLAVSKPQTVNTMLITRTITAKQKVRQKVPGLYAVCR